MIKKFLTISTCIVFGCMITMASLAQTVNCYINDNGDCSVGGGQCLDADGNTGDTCKISFGGPTNRCSCVKGNGNGSGSGIPTLSEWGLIIFTLLLLTGGTLFIMRQPAIMSAMGGGSLHLEGGNPIPFVPTVFIKASTITSLLVLLGFAVAFWFSSPPSTTDIVGTSISAPIFAYLLHLLMLLKR